MQFEQKYRYDTHLTDFIVRLIGEIDILVGVQLLHKSNLLLNFIN